MKKSLTNFGFLLSNKMELSQKLSKMGTFDFVNNSLNKRSYCQKKEKSSCSLSFFVSVGTSETLLA